MTRYAHPPLHLACVRSSESVARMRGFNGRTASRRWRRPALSSRGAATLPSPCPRPPWPCPRSHPRRPCNQVLTFKGSRLPLRSTSRKRRMCASRLKARRRPRRAGKAGGQRRQQQAHPAVGCDQGRPGGGGGERAPRRTVGRVRKPAQMATAPRAEGLTSLPHLAAAAAAGNVPGGACGRASVAGSSCERRCGSEPGLLALLRERRGSRRRMAAPSRIS